MRGPKPTIEITLTPSQRTILERWERERQGPYDRVRRARILLLAAAGARNGAIGRAVDLGGYAVRRWRRRWQQARAALAAATREDLEAVMDEIRKVTSAPRRGVSRAHVGTVTRWKRLVTSRTLALRSAITSRHRGSIGAVKCDTSMLRCVPSAHERAHHLRIPQA